MILGPPTLILPRFGRSAPIRAFRNTDLPVPDGPSSTLTSPGGMSKVTSSQIRAEPKDLVSPSTEIPIPTRIPSDGTFCRHTPPACGLSHCSLRRLFGDSCRRSHLGPDQRRRAEMTVGPTCLPDQPHSIRRRLHRRRVVGFADAQLTLLDGDRRAGGLELALGLLGGFLGDLLQQRLGRAVDEILGFLQAETGNDLADDLDD